MKWFAGGPAMLVTGFPVLSPDLVQMTSTAWFSPDGHFHRAVFPTVELEVVPAPAKAE